VADTLAYEEDAFASTCKTQHHELGLEANEEMRRGVKKIDKGPDEAKCKKYIAEVKGPYNIDAKGDTAVTGWRERFSGKIKAEGEFEDTRRQECEGDHEQQEDRDISGHSHKEGDQGQGYR
jgi:hypothetical protein